ncbi:MAG: SDR family oxidoreductase [Actinomycetota bacterium]
MQDKVVLITGAANGIGLATSQAFASAGARVVMTDIEEPALQKAKDLVGANSIAFRTDVSLESDVHAMVERAIKEAGGLDVIVCNAGVAVFGPAENVAIEDWRWMTDINVWAAVYAIQAALPYFKEKGSGHFVFISSAAGIFGTLDSVAYCMTKFAVYGLAEALAVSLDGSGIGVSVVCPQWVNTNLVDRGRVGVAPGEDADEVKAETSRKVQAAGIPPESVADAIVAGVKEHRFLILPHPEILPLAQFKWSDPDGYIPKAARAHRAGRHMEPLVKP